MILSTTERCLLDLLNDLRFTKDEKMLLVKQYFPVLDAEKIIFFIDRIHYVEILKEYAEQRSRNTTVQTYYQHTQTKFNGNSKDDSK